MRAFTRLLKPTQRHVHAQRRVHRATQYRARRHFFSAGSKPSSESWSSVCTVTPHETTEGRHTSLVVLHHGKANTIDVRFCQEVGKLFSHLSADPKTDAVIVTGRGKIFSAGVDLKQVADGGRAYTDEFLPALDALCFELMQFPKPLVAAINGHAIAGGCILAACADERLMVRGGATIGMPEIKVGVAVPPSAFEVLRSVVSARMLKDLMLTGRSFNAEQAMQGDLVDFVVESDQLHFHALQRALALSSSDAEVFSATKYLLRHPTLERMLAGRSLSEAPEAVRNTFHRNMSPSPATALTAPRPYDVALKTWHRADLKERVEQFLAATLRR